MGMGAWGGSYPFDALAQDVCASLAIRVCRADSLIGYQDASLKISARSRLRAEPGFCLASRMTPMISLLSQDDLHRITRAKGFATTRALARSVRDQVSNARRAEDVTAELEGNVADVCCADGADSE
jgi:hypothetical protein